ncbi:MAG: DUF5914 domain-containing protein [Chloroflexota bacterium]
MIDNSVEQSGIEQSGVEQSNDSSHLGQWYVVAFSESLRPGKTLVKTIADQEIVFWRTSDDDGLVQAASAVCPHWGGPLGEGIVTDDGRLTCPWHGWQFRNGYCIDRPRLKLPRYLAHDDGILLWVRLPWAVEQVTQPPLQSRPSDAYPFWFDIHIESDVYHVQENYLDFLHPAEYHQSVFNHCVYLGKEEYNGHRVNLVELGYKLPMNRSMITRTRVWAPTAYQIRNEVYDGLAVGMVIESHITPLSAERSIIHEVYHVPDNVVPKQGWPMARFFMLKSARKIREEDALFSARRYQLRKHGFVDGRGLPVQDKAEPYLHEWSQSEAADTAIARLGKLVGKIAPSHW